MATLITSTENRTGLSTLTHQSTSKDDTAIFQPFSIPGQQDTTTFGLSWNAPFPLALKANGSPSLAQSIEALEKLAQSGELTRLVKQHGGAILFRGLPITTPDDYSKIAHAFGFRPHVEVGRPPLRTVLAPNVKTANEGPPELPIWPHNEYGWSTINPAWLTFSSLKVPNSGGATPVTSSIYIGHKLSALAPEFLDDLRKKGVKYTYRYTVNEQVSNTGTSVRGAYGEHVTDADDDATARAKIETEVRRHSERFEWHEDGSLSVTHIVPALRIHKPTEAAVFFGNVTSAWGRSRHHGATRHPFKGDDGSYHPPPTFGDGSAIKVEDLDLLLDLATEGAFDVEWEKGDIVLLDNYAVMHSRKPWKGERQVLAALWDGDGRIGDFPEGVELLQSKALMKEIKVEQKLRTRSVVLCGMKPTFHQDTSLSKKYLDCLVDLFDEQRGGFTIEVNTFKLYILSPGVFSSQILEALTVTGLPRQLSKGQLTRCRGKCIKAGQVDEVGATLEVKLHVDELLGASHVNVTPAHFNVQASVFQSRQE
ncbi:hypothetical protein G7046_g1398 [Stylonectria norvegica]|nr:hypothetical protein G7046_g1398 [Stylonectria norvegica]